MTPRSPGPAPVASRRAVFAMLMLALLLAALDHTTVATALPTIVGQLGDLGQLAWVVTAYMLAATVSAPVIGRLSDQLGRKRVYQAAIGVFVLGALLSGSATSLGQLVAARFVQGAGAGGVIALTQTIIADIVPPRERGRYQGLLGAVFGFASVVGPLLGGLFVDHATWRLVFWMNVPLGVLALAVIQTRLHLAAGPGGAGGAGGGAGRRRIDWLGTALLLAGVTSLLLAVSWGGNVLAWRSPALLALVAGGTCALAAFLAVQRRVDEPIVPLRLFRNRVFAVSSALSFVTGLGMFATIVFTPLFLQTVLGVSATASGVLLLPMLAGFITSSVTAGALITRWGRYKPFPVAGTLLATVGVWRMSTLGPDSTYLAAGTAMVLTGLGLGMVVQVVVIAVQNAVDTRDLGSATSLTQFFRTIGGTVGITLYGALLNVRLAGAALERLGADTVDDVLHSPERIAALPAATRAVVQAAMSDGITFLFAVSVPVLAVGFALALALPALPLRTELATPAPTPPHPAPRSRPPQHTVPSTAEVES